MAQIIENFEFTHGNNSHPWDEWFDGQARLLIKEEDFPSNNSMYQTIQQAAKARNMKTEMLLFDAEGKRTTTHGGYTVIKLQAKPIQQMVKKGAKNGKSIVIKEVSPDNLLYKK